ncbi:MAG: NAD-dependent epimerase/dehydratase family protein, partial [Bacteroidota bacterium]|nr:NAD-dependent epimerase/dehydratase family protein [Bacteroidota bacterium]
MKVLITGATGLIGKVLTEKFFSTGIKVNFLTTKKSKIHSTKGASGFYWNPAKKKIDLKCFEGVDSIIHLAGSRISKPWTKSNKKDILSSRVDSTRLLFLSIKNNIESFHIKSIVSASAIGIYPSEFKKTQTEKTNSTINSFMERVVVAWEKEIENFTSLNIPVAKIRIGLVLSFSGGVLKALKIPTNLGLGTYFGNGEQGQPWIHINDLVEIFFKAYKDNWDGIFNGVAPN